MELAQFLTLTQRYCGPYSEKPENLPGLSTYRRSKPSEIEASVYQPVMCLILQGSKKTSSGAQSVTLRQGDAVLVSHDLPVTSRITQASTSAPYCALILSLDLALLRSLREELGDGLPQTDAVRALCAAPADPNWLAPLARYLALADNPQDAQVLGPATLREIHYRLLLSPIGGMLRRLLSVDSHASRVARAISQIRSGFRDPLAVPDLARAAGMSPSSFYDHFKSVTGTTPLQYQKDLRLIAARALLTDQDHSVSAAAFAVGYESPTHFSRDYSRKFGQAPSRDAKAQPADGLVMNA